MKFQISILAVIAIVLISASAGALISRSVSTTGEPDWFDIEVDFANGTNSYTLIEVDEGDNNEERVVTEIFHVFEFSAINPAGAVTWDFGDGITSSEPNPVHTYADTGQYTISLTATAANGCQATFGNTLALSSFSGVEPQFESPICEGSPSYFSVVAPGVSSFSWVLPDGTENEGNPLYHTFDTIPADNVIQLTVLSEYGCELTNDFTIDIHPAPLNPLEGLEDVAICPAVGEILISSNPGFVNHQWSDAFGPIIGATGPELLTGGGTFFISASVRSV